MCENRRLEIAVRMRRSMSRIVSIFGDSVPKGGQT